MLIGKMIKMLLAVLHALYRFCLSQVIWLAGLSDVSADGCRKFWVHVARQTMASCFLFTHFMGRRLPVLCLSPCQTSFCYHKSSTGDLAHSEKDMADSHRDRLTDLTPLSFNQQQSMLPFLCEFLALVRIKSFRLIFRESFHITSRNSGHTYIHLFYFLCFFLKQSESMKTMK